MVLEQHASDIRESQAAGIGLGAQVLQLLQQNDIDTASLGFPAETISILGPDLSVLQQMPYPMLLTAWNVLYYRLRAHFDGFTSPTCPQTTPETSPTLGAASYQTGKRVISVHRSATRSTSDIVLTYVDIHDPTHRRHDLDADLVICADGGHSTIRTALLSQQTPPIPPPTHKYAGYLALRGCVRLLSLPTTITSLVNPTLPSGHLTPSSGYVVTYAIPDEAGSLAPEEQLLNFVWYRPCPETSPTTTISNITSPTEPPLSAILTDISGRRHHTTLPPGTMDMQVWSDLCSAGASVLPAPYVEIMRRITHPFVTAVGDVPTTPTAAFCEGRVLLTGEALGLLRPHAGMAVALAAGQAGLVVELVRGKVGFEEWERLVLDRVEEGRGVSLGMGRRFMGGAWRD